MFWFKKKSAETLHYELYGFLKDEDFRQKARQAVDGFSADSYGLMRVQWHLAETPSIPQVTP